MSWLGQPPVRGCYHTESIQAFILDGFTYTSTKTFESSRSGPCLELLLDMMGEGRSKLEAGDGGNLSLSLSIKYACVSVGPPFLGRTVSA